jgi:hypothetical protein
MNGLNIEALLAKNPQVDRDSLKETGQKVNDARKAVGRKSKGSVVPPFGGRRLRKDDKSKEDTGFTIENRRRA